MRRLPVYIVILFFSVLNSCQKAERVDPIIISNEAQNIGNTQATLIGELQDMGARTNWEFGFMWSDQPGININSGNQIYLGNRNQPGIFSGLVENLTPGTTYYYMSFVADPGFTRIYYGQERDFITQP